MLQPIDFDFSSTAELVVGLLLAIIVIAAFV